MADAAGRVGYADARFVRIRTQRIATRNGELDAVSDHAEEGVGVRARVAGGWGFAATRGSDRDAIEAALARAIEVARALPATCDTELASEPAASGSYDLTTGTDPFCVAFEDKLAPLVASDDALKANPRVQTARSQFVAFCEDKVFASTEGAAYEQRVAGCGGGTSALATDGQDYQVRSYPASFRGDIAQAGFEHFQGLELAANADRVGDEAARLLLAPTCPRLVTAVVLDGEQLALQLHESVGHAVELDRILGTEAAYAGTSFLGAGDLGAFRYGSPLMNVTADATLAGGLGSFRYDDEGVSAKRTPIVTEGMLTGFLSSREAAASIGCTQSAGCMRASGFARQPLVRMTNVNLEPGDAGSLEQLIAATDRGIYMETNRSWSIDSRRLNFQFATEVAYEIVDGKLGRMLKNPSYRGKTPAFWASLDAVCSADEWRLWPVVNCGKGEPGQSMRVSHGTAPARFAHVEVGVA